MKAKKYILSLITIYLCYFTHGMQVLMLSQNKIQFYEKWGYTDPSAGAAAVSMAITALGFGKFLSVWIGGEISDKIGRKIMAITGSILYIVCIGGLLITDSMVVACICSFLAGIATSGCWDSSLYPASQESAPKYAASALVGIKFFVSVAGIIYPLLAVHFASAGNWEMNIWIPLVLSVFCVIFSLISPFAYDDMIKETKTGADGTAKNAAEKEIEEAKARLLVKPNKLVNFITMFYAFLCMFIMYGGQQYTKAFGMNNCGMTEMQSAGLTSIYTVGSIVAVIFWAFIMGKLQWHPLKVVLIDSIFTAIALAIVLVFRTPQVVYLGIGLLGFFAAGGALQAGLRLRQEFCPGPKGRNTGIYNTWMGLASCFLPYIVSSMTKTIGETSAVYTMMTLLLLAAIVATVMMLYLVGQFKKIFGVKLS